MATATVDINTVQTAPLTLFPTVVCTDGAMNHVFGTCGSLQFIEVSLTNL